MMIGLRPHGPIDLVLLPMESYRWEDTEAVTIHMHDIHEDVRREIDSSNEKYEEDTDVHLNICKLRRWWFSYGAICYELFLARKFKTLQPQSGNPFKIIKKIISDAHVLELPEDRAQTL